MKEYWLLLEAYVFIRSNEKQILVYNTFSGKGQIYENSFSLNKIVKELQDKEKLYCISITDSDLEDQKVKEFINGLRDSFSGNLLNKKQFPQKPVVFIPEANINEDLSREEKFSYNPYIFGGTLLKNLTDVSFYLTGECKHTCVHCGKIDKQTLWCTKKKDVLAIEKIESVFEQIKYSSVFDLHFLGGDILSYPSWGRLMSLLKSISCKKNFYIPYLSCLNPEYKDRLAQLDTAKNEYIKVLVNWPELIKEDFHRLDLPNSGIEYIFLITNEEEYEYSNELVEEKGINGKIMPFFTGKNPDFFTNYIYLDQEDILSTPWKKNEIFSNQYVNTNDFGKLTVDTNGDVYVNLNFPPVGKWDDEIKRLVYEQLKEGSQWRRVRSRVSRCNECLFCYICPPLSNYEIVIGKSDLCHV